jgi:hypothetical protein
LFFHQGIEIFGWKDLFADHCHNLPAINPMIKGKAAFSLVIQHTFSFISLPALK